MAILNHLIFSKHRVDLWSVITSEDSDTRAVGPSLVDSNTKQQSSQMFPADQQLYVVSPYAISIHKKRCLAFNTQLIGWAILSLAFHRLGHGSLYIDATKKL